MDALIISGIVLALLLNFVNGLNDASHSIATVVETRALSPWKASLSSALANFIGPFIFTTAVAATIGTALVTPEALTPLSLVIAMLTSIILVFIATHIGLPVSSSHALIGGILGTGVAVAGLDALILPPPGTLEQLALYSFLGGIIGAIIFGILAWYLEESAQPAVILGAIFGISVSIPLLMMTGVLVLSGILAIVVFIFISPIIGFSTAFLFDLLVSHLFRYSRQNRMKRIFQPLQVAASLFQAAGHGANDGQHAVGVITALLLAGGLISSFVVPSWVVVLSAAAIALGTSFGGWKVINKLGKRDNENPALPGILCSILGRCDPWNGHHVWYPGLINSGDERSNRRGRCDQGAEGGQVGGPPPDDAGMGDNDPPCFRDLLVRVHGRRSCFTISFFKRREGIQRGVEQDQGIALS